MRAVGDLRAAEEALEQAHARGERAVAADSECDPDSGVRGPLVGRAVPLSGVVPHDGRREPDGQATHP